jgi:hypothetical protein
MKKQENQINEKGWRFFGGLVGEITIKNIKNRIYFVKLAIKWHRRVCTKGKVVVAAKLMFQALFAWHEGSTVTFVVGTIIVFNVAIT